MDVMDKLKILSDSAKYDAACTSSGITRGGIEGSLGNTANCGICHSFAADGRCISLLKVLMTNYCIYDCKYCINRKSNDVPRTRFTPRELADLTINFYKRNYIEGLFLSSGIINSPDYTCEQMIETLSIIRNEYKFNGYIHAKTIPGCDPLLIEKLGLLADRISVNIELPSEESLKKLCPQKSKSKILIPMKQITTKISENTTEIVKYKSTPKFAPAGQSTQMIIGASPDTDFQIMHLTEGLYKKYRLKRVFYSAYVPVGDQKLLPSVDTKPPLLREHRLYQADWLLRFYGFRADELLDQNNQNFNPLLDPKCNWAVGHIDLFPIEVNKAPYEMLLRVPGIGVLSAKRIMMARKTACLDYRALKKLGVVLKRAQFFITCNNKKMDGLKFTESALMRGLISDSNIKALENSGYSFTEGAKQLSLFENEQNDQPTLEDLKKCITGQI